MSVVLEFHPPTKIAESAPNVLEERSLETHYLHTSWPKSVERRQEMKLKQDLWGKLGHLRCLLTSFHAFPLILWKTAWLSNADQKVCMVEKRWMLLSCFFMLLIKRALARAWNCTGQLKNILSCFILTEQLHQELLTVSRTSMIDMQETSCLKVSWSPQGLGRGSKCWNKWFWPQFPLHTGLHPRVSPP